MSGRKQETLHVTRNMTNVGNSFYEDVSHIQVFYEGGLELTAIFIHSSYTPKQIRYCELSLNFEEQPMHYISLCRSNSALLEIIYFMRILRWRWRNLSL